MTMKNNADDEGDYDDDKAITILVCLGVSTAARNWRKMIETAGTV